MSELAAVVRFVHLASAVLLAGSFAFVVLIERGSAALALHRRIAAWSLGVVVVSAAAGAWLQALNVAGEGSVGAVATLLRETLYGNVWLARMGLAAALALLLAASPGMPGGGLALSACLLATHALSGHAAAGEGGELALQVSTDAVHLLAAGAWLGSLVPLALHLRRGGPAAQATSRFSLMGIACVTTLLLTGLWNSWFLVGGWPQLLGTPYGRLLLAKLALLLPLLAVAAYNLTRLDPAIMAGAPDARARAARLGRNALIEAGLGLGILAIVGFLGTTPPARHVPPDWPFDFRWDWTVLNRSPKANVELDQGLMWLSGGLTLLTLAFFLERARWLLVVGAVAVVIHAGNRIVAPLETDAYPTTFHRPAVPYQAISVANGRALYAKNCVACHGVGGYGDGPAAAGMNPKPADLTASHTNDHTAGDLFWWVSRGIPPGMPGFGGTMTDEETWDLINFARALASGEKAKRDLAPVVDAKVAIVAPDFVYSTAGGETRALKDHRGARFVLLALGDVAPDPTALRRAGVELILVPRDVKRLKHIAGFVVVEGNAEIHDTYALFAGSFDDEPPKQVEFLIDRFGYIRARWLAPSKTDAMLKQVEELKKEKPRDAAPDDHVH